MQSAQFALHAEIEERHWWFTARRRILRAMVEEVLEPCDTEEGRFAGMPSGDGRLGNLPHVIVDVGCGTGANLASLADAYRCVGIDTSAEAIDLARTRFPQVEFLCGYAPQDLGKFAGQASLFLLTDVLEHVPDDFELLSSLLAAASPGAYFLITVPANLALWSEHDVSFGHYRRYDRQRLARVWQDLPVTTLLNTHYNSRLYPLVRAVRGWNRLRGRTGGAAGTDFKIPSAPLNRALEGIFAGESHTLLNLARGRRGAGYESGVSLIALLRREEGAIEVRSKPESVGRDYFDPARGELLCS